MYRYKHLNCLLFCCLYSVSCLRAYNNSIQTGELDQKVCSISFYPIYKGFDLSLWHHSSINFAFVLHSSLENLRWLLQLCWQESCFHRVNGIKHSYTALWQVRGDSRHRRSLRRDPSIPQGSITLPSSLTQNLSLEQQQLASRVHFNFYQTSAVFQVCSFKNNIPSVQIIIFCLKEKPVCHF